MSASYQPPAYSGSMDCPLNSDEARAFYSQRIALFHKTVGLLSLGFLILGNAIGLLDPRNRFEAEDVLHLVASLTSISIWLGLRRYLPPASWLPRIDVASTIAVMSVYIAMAFCSVPRAEVRIDLVLTLIAMIVQMARAVVVPSSARQTFFIGLGVSAGLLLMTYDVARKVPHPADVPFEVLGVAYITLWCAITVTVATLASRVIYGLRQRVQDAQQFGQYTLDEKIGEGGMGIVYRAHHSLLRRPTALKLLPAERAGAGNLSRFEREVQLTSSLTHPNTVAIYDYGHTPDGIFYYAMEYLDGIDLEELMQVDGPQDPARVVHILSQVCGALAEAHDVGLVHRDIKPANILLCKRGGVPDVAKVVDFGLVKVLEPSGVDPSLSAVNAIMGTPLYMAPEAIVSPERVDARSDLYALGAVAYYLLTGHPVFEGNNLVEICSHHLQTAPVPLSERLGRRLPEKLEAAVMSCLAKDPSARPNSAGALKKAVESAGVRIWTEDEARSWWRERAPRGTLPAPKSGAHTRSEVALNLTIDLRKRAAGAGAS